MGAERSAVAILTTADKRLLLESRPNLPGKLQCPGMVGLFGGGINPEESPEEGMRRELGEEVVTPNGPEDLTALRQVWQGRVGTGDVSLFVADLACTAAEVEVHPNLAEYGTGIIRIPADTYPVRETTMFAMRALVAHTTRDYENL